MKNWIALYVLLCQSLSIVVFPLSAAQQRREAQPLCAKSQQDKDEWRVATYRGLTVGKSTREDMLRVLGIPQWSGPPGDQSPDEPEPEMWNEYTGGGELPGKLTVVVDERSGVILGIDLYPVSLTKQAAIEHFGRDFVVTRYDFDSCLSKDDGESAPMYESPDGQIVNVEYRDRGIALAIGYQDRVTHISYVKGPIGATSSKCKPTTKTP